MLSFISAKEAAEKWNISQRRVALLCAENRIEGAMRVGNVWIIPSNAKKPEDKRATKQEKQSQADVKPFLKWAGGKGKLLNELEEYLPKGDAAPKKYVEPMVGGGAFLFHLLSKYDFEEVYICDKNPDLVNAYNVVKENVDELIARLEEMQTVYLPMNDNGRKYYYYSMRDKFNNMPLNADTALEKAVLFLFLNKTCFNGLYRVNGKGQFNVPMGAYKNPTVCDEDNLRSVSAALKNVTVLLGDYTLLREYIDETTFAYFDPPYRPLSKTSAFTAYNTEDFNDDEQIRLKEFIDEISARGAKALLSNSDPQNVDESDTFFEDLYRGYTIKKVEAVRAINSKADKRGKITELLINN